MSNGFIICLGPAARPLTTILLFLHSFIANLRAGTILLANTNNGAR